AYIDSFFSIPRRIAWQNSHIFLFNNMLRNLKNHASNQNRVVRQEIARSWRMIDATQKNPFMTVFCTVLLYSEHRTTI
ncbi:MAG: hypothetical protein RBU25_18425, partial [Lentisphaeria bacterium]|nr:hypothetical protein [Lentisphaeria bacterium]